MPFVAVGRTSFSLGALIALIVLIVAILAIAGAVALSPSIAVTMIAALALAMLIG